MAAAALLTPGLHLAGHPADVLNGDSNQDTHIARLVERVLIEAKVSFGQLVYVIERSRLRHGCLAANYQVA